jgi:hypothetical protein
MSEARVRVIGKGFKLEPQVTRGRNFASGKDAAIAGRCERTVCISAGHRRACPRSRLTPKGAWSQGTEGRDVDGKGRELHRSAGRLWDLFRQERRDAPIRYVRSKLHPLCDCLFGS